MHPIVLNVSIYIVSIHNLPTLGAPIECMSLDLPEFICLHANIITWRVWITMFPIDSELGDGGCQTLLGF